MLITDLTNLTIAIDARAGIDIHAADTHLLFALAGAVDDVERAAPGRAKHRGSPARVPVAA